MRSTSRSCWPALVLPALLSVGCATTAKISQFETFAQAGKAYAEAMNGSPSSDGGLLDAAKDVLVDTNSEKLLQTVADFPGSVDRAAFKEQDSAMRANLSELDLLKRQVTLLADYFTALSNLASTKAPESFGAELGSTVTSLDALSGALGETSLFKDTAAAQSVAQGVGTLIVRGVQLRALQRELKERKQTIAEVLGLHQALLAALKAQISADQQLTRDRQYEEEVVAPFLAGQVQEGNAASWKQDRVDLLGPAPVAQQVANAESAVKNLRSAWAKLLVNKLTASDVQAVVSDLEPILAGLGALKKTGTEN